MHACVGLSRNDDEKKKKKKTGINTRRNVSMPFSAHSFNSRFSHAGLASLFITVKHFCEEEEKKKKQHNTTRRIYFIIFLCSPYGRKSAEKSARPREANTRSTHSKTVKKVYEGREFFSPLCFFLGSAFSTSDRQRAAEIFVVRGCQSSTGIQFL